MNRIALWRWAAPLCLVGLLAAGCGRSQSTAVGGKDQQQSDGSSSGVQQSSTAAGQTQYRSAEELLAAMSAAYRKARTYSDRGVVRFTAEVGQKKYDEEFPLSAALQRPGPNDEPQTPDRFRLHAYQAMAASNGEKFVALLDRLPDQAVVRKAPLRCSLTTVFDAEPTLAMVIGRGIAGHPPQVLLLLHDEAVKILLHGATEKPELAEPGEIDGRLCYRVNIKFPDGTLVLWIDQQTLVLRRAVLPTGGLHRQLSAEGQVERLSLVVELTAAQLNGPIDPKLFELAPPPGARAGKFFVLPHPAQLLGRPVPEFKLVDLNGNAITREALQGRVVVLDFWATWCGPCRQTLPALDQVYQKLKDDRRVAILAASVDEPSVENKELLRLFEELRVGLPIARVVDEDTPRALQVAEVPYMLLIDNKGVVQAYELGYRPKLAEELIQKIASLLQGQQIFEKQLAEYQQQLEQIERQTEKFEEMAARGEPVLEEEIEQPPTQIAPRSDPQKLRLKQLWKCTEVRSPGNILVLQDNRAKPRLLVLESYRSIAEIGLDGKLVALHDLGLVEGQEWVFNLRACCAANGAAYLAAFGSRLQRCHVFDASFRKLFSYPEDALEHKHEGISDVQLADLDGDGTPELYVGYWGVVGIHAVSLQGKRTAANKLIAFTWGIAPGPADAQSQRLLYCINPDGSLVALDSKLERKADVALPGRRLQSVVAADLRGDGQLLWCGLVSPEIGQQIAVGFDLAGRELWSYTLPAGIYQQPIERIIPGRITAQPPGQWILPGADGSIHILTADGSLIDQFNYGASLHGLATVEIDGRPALIVATQNGIEALAVE